jgi:hypothetical protein
MASDPDSRRDSWAEGVPLWARMIAIVGIPGVIAIFLVYVGAAAIPKMARVELDTQHGIEKLEEWQRKHAADTAAMIRTLQRICVNTATDPPARDRCLQ